MSVFQGTAFFCELFSFNGRPKGHRLLLGGFGEKKKRHTQHAFLSQPRSGKNGEAEHGGQGGVQGEETYGARGPAFVQRSLVHLAKTC